MNDSWWVQSQDEVEGPYSVEDLKTMVDSGAITSNTRIRLERTTRWVAASSFPWLFEAPPASPPAVPERSISIPPLLPPHRATRSTLAIAILAVAALILLCLLAAILIRSAGLQTASRKPATGPSKVPDDGQTNTELESARTSSRFATSATNDDFDQLSTRPTATAIADATDESTVGQAVGLVVCGWWGKNATNEEFEIPQLFQIHSQVEYSLLTDEQKQRMETVRIGTTRIYVEPLLGITGTCFVISPDGFALTNGHIVADVVNLQRASITLQHLQDQFGLVKLQPKIWVFLQGRIHVAEVRHVSPNFDLAILKMNLSGSPFFRLSQSKQFPRSSPVWSLGFPAAARIPLSQQEELTQTRKIRMGTRIMDHFKPSDLEYIQTDGTISVTTHREGVGQVIQHNADVSGGNSGGPLIDPRGVVIGINTLSVTQATGGSASGIFYALAIGQVCPEVSQFAIQTHWTE